jgi:hypothetical protein
MCAATADWRVVAETGVRNRNPSEKLNDRMGPIAAMNFAAFDLNLLRVFDALMRERSVTRAGALIGLSRARARGVGAGRTSALRRCTVQSGAR